MQTDLITGIIVAIVTAFFTYVFTQATNHLNNYRQGMKDINETFYKPLISLYWSAHHAYAFYFVDLLMANQKRVAPRIEREIWNLYQCYSSYQNDTGQMTEEEKKFIEESFRKIFEYVEKQYARNERKLYHTLTERIRYRISEWNTIRDRMKQ